MDEAQGKITAKTPALRRTQILLFILGLGVYSYFYQAGGWNQNARFDLVRGIVEEGSAKIDRYHENTGDKGQAGRPLLLRQCTGRLLAGSTRLRSRPRGRRRRGRRFNLPRGRFVFGDCMGG